MDTSIREGFRDQLPNDGSAIARLIAAEPAIGSSPRPAAPRRIKPRLFAAPATAQPPAYTRVIALMLGAAALLTLALAYVWTYRLGPEVMPTFWGIYKMGPLIWASSACCSLLAWRILPRGANEQPALALALIAGLFAVAVTLVLGMIAAMGYSPYAHTPEWIATNFWFVGAPLVATECARAMLLRMFAPHRPTLAIATTALLFALLGVSYRRLLAWDGGENELMFTGSVLLPAFASSLLASLFVFAGGPLAGIAYRAPAAAFMWFSPVLPDLPWLMAAFAGVATPALTLWLIDSMHATDTTAEAEPTRSFIPSTAWLLSGLVSVLLLWFSFGFFGVKPIFIPSTSMEPEVSAGSIVVIREVSGRDVQLGDVILYDLNGTDVLHRITAVHADGTFTTKGDDNNTPDPQPVSRSQIKGRLMFDVPYVGWAPIWVARALGTAVGDR